VKWSITSSSALRPAPIQVEVLDVVELSLFGTTLFRAVGIDVGVGQDLVQPRLKVCPLLEPTKAAVGLQVRLLHQIFGVGRVAGHAQGGGVERRHELHGLVREARLIRHGVPQ
jgi:hypothetical protein